MEVQAEFKSSLWWPSNNYLYSCEVQGAEIRERTITKFNGTHKGTQKEINVSVLKFLKCPVDFVPKGLFTCFKNLSVLHIHNSQIKNLRKSDFDECKKLSELSIAGANIEYLPGNLLEHMPNLEKVSFNACGIKYIGPEILDCLRDVKAVFLRDNVGIDTYYDPTDVMRNDLIIRSRTLSDLKNRIMKVKPPVGYNKISESRQRKVING